MRRKKIYVGDIFRFGPTPLEQAYGQVLKSDILQYVMIFEPVFEEGSNLEDVMISPTLLSGWTADARFIHGDWKLVGNSAPPGDFVFPEYKVESAGEIWVTDNDGKHLRPADPQEAARLYLRSSHSPIAFEKAFWAYHGRRPWEDRFNRLLYAGTKH
jgi:hypothetical protein